MAQEHLGNPLGADPTVIGTITDALVGGILGAIDAKNDTQFVRQVVKAQSDAFNKEMLLDQRGLQTAMTGADTFGLQLEDEASALRYADPENGAIYGRIENWFQDSMQSARTPQSRAAVENRYNQLIRQAQGSFSKAQQSSFKRAGLGGDFSWYTPDNKDSERVMLEFSMADPMRRKWADLTAEAEKFNMVGKAVTGPDVTGLRDPYPLMETHPEVYELLATAQNFSAAELSTLPNDQRADIMAKLSQLQPAEIRRASGAADSALAASEFDASMKSRGVEEAVGLLASGGVAPMQTQDGGTLYRFNPGIVDSLASKWSVDPSTALEKFEAIAPILTGNAKQELKLRIAGRLGGPGEYAAAEQDKIYGAMEEFVGIQQMIAPIAEGKGQAAALREVGLGVGAALPFKWASDAVNHFDSLHPTTKRDLLADTDRLANFLMTAQRDPKAGNTYIPSRDLDSSKALYLANSLAGDPNAMETTLTSLVRGSMTSEARSAAIQDQIAYFKMTGQEGSAFSTDAQSRLATLNGVKMLSGPEARAFDQQVGGIIALSRANFDENSFRNTFAPIMFLRDKDGNVVTQPMLDPETGEPTGEVQEVINDEGRMLIELFNSNMPPETKLRQAASIITSGAPQLAEMIEQTVDTTGALLNQTAPAASMQQATAQIATAAPVNESDVAFLQERLDITSGFSAFGSSPATLRAADKETLKFAKQHPRFVEWESKPKTDSEKNFITLHGETKGTVQQFLNWLEQN